MSGANENEKAFQQALDAVKAGEAQDEKPATQPDKNFVDLYNAIMDPKLSREASGDLALRAALQLKPETKDSELTWAAFHDDVSQLEQQGRNDAAAKLLAKAIDSGQGLSGIRSDAAAETASNVGTLSDAQLARLSSTDRQTLEAQLDAASKTLSDAGVSSDAKDIDDQFVRLKKVDGMKADNKVDAVAIPARWDTDNAGQFFQAISAYHNTDPGGATNVLVDAITGPIANTRWNDAAWQTFQGYIADLSDTGKGNAERNLATADKALQRMYDRLPEGDELHRKMLQDMAHTNGYDLETRTVTNPPVIPEVSGDEESRVRSGAPRYQVQDTGSDVTAHLSVPGQGPGQSTGVKAALS